MTELNCTLEIQGAVIDKMEMAKREKIYGMHKLVGLQLFWSGTPTFCQMGVLNSCFQNSSKSSGFPDLTKGHEQSEFCSAWFRTRIVGKFICYLQVKPVYSLTSVALYFSRKRCIIDANAIKVWFYILQKKKNIIASNCMPGNFSVWFQRFY